MPATVNPPAQSRCVCLLLGRSESSGKRDVIDVHKTGNYSPSPTVLQVYGMAICPRSSIGKGDDEPLVLVIVITRKERQIVGPHLIRPHRQHSGQKNRQVFNQVQFKMQGRTLA